MKKRLFYLLAATSLLITGCRRTPTSSRSAGSPTPIDYYKVSEDTWHEIFDNGFLLKYQGKFSINCKSIYEGPSKRYFDTSIKYDDVRIKRDTTVKGDGLSGSSQVFYEIESFYGSNVRAKYYSKSFGDWYVDKLDYEFAEAYREIFYFPLLDMSLFLYDELENIYSLKSPIKDYTSVKYTFNNNRLVNVEYVTAASTTRASSSFSLNIKYGGLFTVKLPDVDPEYVMY